MAQMNKKRNKDLLYLADRVLNEKEFIPMNDNSILDSYNGQVASLSVSIAINGLLPTLAIFYQDKPETDINKAYRRNVLNLVAKMVTMDNEYWNFSRDNLYAKNLLSYVITLDKQCSEESTRGIDTSKKQLNNLKIEIIECAIALKQVVRTYKLVSV
jgi:CRISPR type III-B/RAMP module-associated protein Cmr5